MNPRNKWIGFPSWVGIVVLTILSMHQSLTVLAINHRVTSLNSAVRTVSISESLSPWI